jgi:hypothetical protein
MPKQITPEMIAKTGTEAAHQAAVFCWAAQHYEEWPVLRWMHSSLNGAMFGDDLKGRMIRAARQIAQGLKPGVADIFLPVKRGEYSGLYIEMKKPSIKPKKPGSKGGLSDEQIEFKDFVKEQGFGWCVAYSWKEAVSFIIQYLNWS